LKFLTANFWSFPSFLRIPLMFLLLFATVSCLKANDLPITIECENNICYCNKDKSKNFNVDSILKKLPSYNLTDTIVIACIYHQIAVKYHKDNEYQNAIKFYNKAIKLREKFDDGWLWKSQMNIARCYFYLHNFKETIEFLEKAKEPFGNPKKPKDTFYIFKFIAISYKEIGEIEQALLYIKKAINISTEKEKIWDALETYSEILIETKDSINLLNAIICLDSLKSIYHVNKDTFNLLRVKNLLGTASDFNKNFGKSLQHYKDALKLEQEVYEKTILLNNIATTYFNLKQYNNSFSNLKNSLELNKLHFQSKFRYQYAANYENFGDYYGKLKKIDSALINYQKALINLTNNFRNEKIHQNPNPKDTTLFIYSNPDMIRVLHLKATAAYKYYQQNQNIQFLDLSHQTNKTLIDFHYKLQKDISTENSRLFQAKNILEYLEQALEVAYAKQKLRDFDAEATFRLMEKNKATVLLQSMNEADALQFANLPYSLLLQEKNLKIAITYRERQLNDAIIDEDTITKIIKLKSTLFENKEKYHRLIKNLEDNHPDYYKLKYQQNQSTLKEVQSQLNNKTALLEYFVGSKHLYILSIQNNKTKLYQIK